MLTTIEDHHKWLDEDKPWPPKPQKSSVWDMTHVEDEHIFPQSPDGGVPSRFASSIHRLGNQAFWGPDDNKAKEASNRLPTDSVKIQAYRSASSRMLSKIGDQLLAAPKWGKTQIDERERLLTQQALRLWALSPSARTVARKLDAKRIRLFAWRSPTDVRAWAVPTEVPGAVGHEPGVGFRFPTNVHLARGIAQGDTLLVYDPDMVVTTGDFSGPRVVAHALVDRVEFSEPGVRSAIYKADTYNEIDGHTPLHAVATPMTTMPRRPTRIIELRSVAIPLATLQPTGPEG
jgi:hypothetical protein